MSDEDIKNNMLSILQIDKETSWGNKISPLASEAITELLKNSLPNGIAGIQEKKAQNFSVIITNALKKVRDTGKEPKVLPSKVLEPLINEASREDDPDIQMMWSNLLANVLTEDQSLSLQRNAIEILGRMSNAEAKLLNSIYQKHLEKRAEYYKDPFALGTRLPSIQDFNPDYYSYRVSDFYRTTNYIAERTKTSGMLSNLIANGLIRWEIEVKVNSAEAPINHSGKADVDIDLEVVDDEYIKITKFGVDFVELCRFEK